VKRKAKKTNSLVWLFEPLESDAGFVQRKLFGFDAAYLDGFLYAAVSEGEELWSGMLVATSREHHAALGKQFPSLKPHPVLGKWLYISLSHKKFEATATEIIALALRRDPRLGVESSSPKARPRR
jgi:hypothetical protein